MTKIDRIALVTLMLATLSAGAAYVQVQRSERTVSATVERCEEENVALAARPPVPNEPWQNDPYVCDPAVLPNLVDLKKENVGIQREIVIARSKVYEPQTVYLGAALIAMLGCTPWAWYFLLRRIRELVLAITGK